MVLILIIIFFFFTKKQLPSFTASEQSDMLFNFFFKKSEFFFSKRFIYIYIYVCVNMDKLLKGERKKHNNYSILIIICTDDTHKQMNHTTTIFYQFISQSIYLPVFVGVFLNQHLDLLPPQNVNVFLCRSYFSSSCEPHLLLNASIWSTSSPRCHGNAGLK